MTAYAGGWLCCRRALATAASVLVLLLVSYLVLRFGARRLRFNYSNRVLTQQDYQALAGKFGWEKAIINEESKYPIHGIIRRPQNPLAPWVLFYPGNDQTQLATSQTLLELLRGDNDWGLVAYAYRGYDATPGTPSHSALISDAWEIYQAVLRKEQVSHTRVHVVAFSIGGHLAASVVARAVTSNQAPASLTLAACVDDVVMVTPARLERFSLGERFNTMPLLANLHAPILVVQGDADEAFHTPKPGRTIAAALGNRAKYLEIPGAGHLAALTSEPAVGGIRAFIAHHD